MPVTDAPPLPTWLESQLPFGRKTATVKGRSVHFVDEGPVEGPVALLVHGNPTWSYLWRKVIRILDGRVRVVAPDLVGLGLSEKPRSVSEHRLEMHVATILALVEELDLRDVVLVGQDWGGPVVGGVGARAPDRVKGLVFGNTAVFTPRRPLRPTAFHRFSHVPVVSDALFRITGFPLQVLHLSQGDRRSIGPRERRAYRWPLRRMADRVAPLALARMVPNADDHPTLAVLDEIDAWLRTWKGPAALVWGTKDPILGRALRRMREVLPRATVEETGAGHFLQEEVPEPLAEAIVRVAGD